MLSEGFKPKWWLPLLVFFTPGSCYAYAAIFPSYRSDFAIAGSFLTIATSALMTWRVLRPRQTETHYFRLIGIQGITIALFLISYRFWLASLTISAIAVGVALLCIYIVSWLAPVIAPSFAKRFYRDIWFPKSRLMRALVAIALTLGGGAGAVGAIIGMNASEVLGDNLWPFMAVLTTIILVFGSVYISTGLWRQKYGMNAIQSVDEDTYERITNR